MFKKYVLCALAASLAASISAPAFCDEAVFKSAAAEGAKKTEEISNPTARPAGENASQNSVKKQNYINAINNLDSVQVENRNKLVEYRSKYSEVDAQYKLVGEERKMLRKEIKKIEKEIRTVDKTKDALRNM